MRPLDPRLLRWARATRTFLLVAVLLGAVIALLVIAQESYLAEAITRAFREGATVADLSEPLTALALVVVARAVVGYASEVAAFRAAAAAKSQLRLALVAHAVRLGPGYLAGARSGDLAQLATRGVDALDAYFARYLPQLVLAVVVPLTVGLVVLTNDVIAAVIVGFTVPLIPVFMALIGLYTQTRVDRQWRTLGVLSGHFLDVVAGLPTLKVFGRAKAQAQTLRDVGDQYRRATLGVLRISFLSSMVLELLATISVALVAVSIGLRLVDGGLDLRTSLLVLILVPEAYLPLRLVGMHFHAAAEGLGAAGRVFEVLETPLPVRGNQADLPDLATATLRIDGLTVRYPGRDVDALRAASFDIPPGQVTALVGPSGGGKSTVLSVLLGFVEPAAGRILLQPAGAEPVDLAEFDIEVWRRQIGWVPQSPHLLPGTIADAVRLGRPDATDEQVLSALAAAGLAGDPTLPAGAATVIAEDGSGLSTGQRRRVAVARAFVRDAPLLVLDEPTAALDGATEDMVLAAVRAARAAGRTVLLVAHRPSLVALADQVVQLAAPEPDPVDAEPEDAATRAALALPGLDR